MQTLTKPIAINLPFPKPPNSLKPKTLIPRSTKWADRLLTDFFPPPPPPPPPTLGGPTTDPSRGPHLIVPSVSQDSDRSMTLPIDFYAALGAEPHFLADGIRRAFDSRVSKPPQLGFSQDALFGRRQILQAACDTLSSPGVRGDYNRGLVEDREATLSTHVPWDKVPGALCVLQEAGETELVLEVGKSLLKERLPKNFKQDIVLVMALAYVDFSRDAMAQNPPDFVRCCEVLERALKLLEEEGASNLAPDLRAQIDETLEEINPRRVLDLLALPLDARHQTEREEGLRGVRNILWSVGKGGAAVIGGGFTRESFMNEAFTHMTALEQVDLFTATPSNIPAESFEVYGVALALVAQAFVDKKPHLIRDADNLFHQLQQTKVTKVGTISDYATRADMEVDFALERGLCALLVGDLDGCRSWLGIDRENSPYKNTSIVEFIMDNSDTEADNDLLPGLCKLLETWLIEVVFFRFRDTHCIQFRLGDYYDDPTVLRYLENMDGGGASPLAAAAAIVKIGTEATAVLDSVRSSFLQTLQKVFPVNSREETGARNDDVIDSTPRIEIQNSLEDSEQYNADAQGDVLVNMNNADPTKQELPNQIKDASLKIMCAGVVVGLVTLAGLQSMTGRRGLPVATKELCSVIAPNVISDDEKLDEVPKMDAIFAETLVRKWQNIKSQALGPDHCLAELPKVLDGQMLKIWTDRAREIDQKGWVWGYNLLNVTIDSVTVSQDGKRATVEATIEEAAQLTDNLEPEHDDSYSTTYTTRYEMTSSPSGWRITRGAVLKS